MYFLFTKFTGKESNQPTVYFPTVYFISYVRVIDSDA